MSLILMAYIDLKNNDISNIRISQDFTSFEMTINFRCRSLSLFLNLTFAFTTYTPVD